MQVLNRTLLKNNPTNWIDWLGLKTCGSGWNEGLVPDNPGYPFSECCDAHDIAFDEQVGFSTANEAFRDCLEDICDSLNLPSIGWSNMSAEHEDLDPFQQTRQECNNLASLYSNAVTGEMGEGAYNAAESDIDSATEGQTDYGFDTDGWGE